MGDSTECAVLEIIEAAPERRLFIPLLLGSICGLRRGEITALKWRSVDLKRRQLAVVASTEQTRDGTRDKDAKNSKCRTLALSEITVEELRKHRVAQAQELLRLGMRLTDDTYVVAHADGQPLQPNSLTHAVRLFMKQRAGKVRLHGLRHSHARHMLASNVHPKIVQERFGHSRISVTMNIYSHLMPNMQADAVARVNDVLHNAMLRQKAREGTENKR